MSSTKLSKIDVLTPDQERALEEYRNQWLTIGRSCAPADRPAAEAVFRAMYTALGEPEPYIWWVPGPATGSLVRAVLSRNLWDNLGDNLWDNLGANLGDNLWANLGANLRANLGANLRDNLGANLRDNLGANLRANLWDNLGDNLVDNLWANLWDNLGDNLVDNLGDNLRWRFWGAHEAYWPAYFAWPHEALRSMHTPAQLERLGWWLTLARSCGWWEPYRGVVFACERPERQDVDERGRLHRADGPALVCRDGFAVYAWHGTRVPHEVVEQPESITAEQVLTERNAEVARVMYERMGDRFWAEAAATVVDRDVDGAGQQRELVSVQFGSRTEPLLRVHVQCPSTGHEYWLKVPPTMRNCQEAVAWTFFAQPDEYAPVREA